MCCISGSRGRAWSGDLGEPSVAQNKSLHPRIFIVLMVAFCLYIVVAPKSSWPEWMQGPAFEFVGFAVLGLSYWLSRSADKWLRKD